MCLDVNFLLNNRDAMKDTERTDGNTNNPNSSVENSIVRVTGGNLHDFSPVFDRSGE